MPDTAHEFSIPQPMMASIRPVSGRYEGEMSLPQPGRLFLDLRIDVDAAAPNTIPVNRVSGDLYQILRSNLPGQPVRVSRTYIESWIMDDPEVEWADDHASIDGPIRFWTGTHAATTASIRIEWDPLRQARSAIANFAEVDGSMRSFTCHRMSDTFRQLNLEIDVCSSVNQPPLIPNYDTNWHSDRPADLPHRTLTIESAYREAGVAVTIDPTHTVIDDSAAPFTSWTPAELHDAMETSFSRFGGAWPNWAMWGLLAGLFERPSVGGIMFDAAAVFGGAGKAPERQGFAVFRNHSWFANLASGPPATQEQAWAIRHFLYTWVHEAGHAFNFLHSWDKGRPDSLSWMNYDWRYEQRNGPGTFWKRFSFQFDNDELIHIRHGNRASVIMGGDPWSSGSHMDAPNLAMAQIEGEPPLELVVRSKGYFELMETVLVELRLRNLTNDTPVTIDKRLQPEYGGVAIYIQGPDGGIASYDPVICALGTPEPHTLAPAGQGQEGNDRYSREIFLTYGAKGFTFNQPGEYRIRAVYQGQGDFLIPSNTHRIRIGSALSGEANRMAQDYFSDDVGLALYLRGSRSPYLRKGAELLEDLAERFKDSMLGGNIALSLADGLSRPFFRVESPTDPKMKLSAKADPEKALRLTEPVLKLLRGQKGRELNLAYGRAVRRRAGYFKDIGSPEKAGAEIAALRTDLSSRGVNQPVLQHYENLETALSGTPAKPLIKPRKSPTVRSARTNR